MFVRLLPLLALLACDGVLRTSSSGCTYEDVEGTCTFTDVTADVGVSFTFQAYDGSGSESGTLLIGDEATVPDQACIDTLGIAVEDVVECNKSVLISESGEDGECEPFQWEFDDLDLWGCEH